MTDPVDGVDTVERRLDGRSARGFPFGPGCTMVMGGVLLAAGAMFATALGLAFLFAAFVGSEIPRVTRVMAPGPILTVIGVGVGLLWTGLGRRRREERGKEWAALHPDAPWFADWPWNPAGTYAEPAWGGGRGLIVMALVVLVMTPFNVIWLYVLDPREDPRNRALGLMVLIPDFFLYLLLRALFSMARERIRFGRPYLRFDEFPFLLGQSLRAHVTAKVFAGQEGVVATLRCIDERTMKGSGGRAAKRWVQPFQLYEARQTLPGRFGGEDVPVAFALPETRATGLREQPPCYWELELRGHQGRTIFFTVPVYARPGLGL
jgi:hypothetical protein